MRLATLALSVSALSAVPAHAEAERVPRLGSGLPLAPTEADEFDDTYRIGDEWGKHAVKLGDLSSTPQLERAAEATAKLNGATSFYLGKFAGKHVLATNHHVCTSTSACVQKSATFPLLSKSARVTQTLGSWDSIDFSLHVIDVKPTDEAALLAVAANLDWHAPIYQGQPLFTAGFGIADNPFRSLQANFDGDCKVFSGEDEFRFMGDPDQLNPADYKAWSFSNGCDVSHGDSGSAMVDRDTGKPVGIIWTGKIPKAAAVQSTAHLNDIFQTRSEEIWTELSFAVPAAKIREKLAQVAADPATPAANCEVLEALIAD